MGKGDDMKRLLLFLMLPSVVSLQAVPSDGDVTSSVATNGTTTMATSDATQDGRGQCPHDSAYATLWDCTNACRNHVGPLNITYKVAWKVLKLNRSEYNVSDNHILTAAPLRKQYTQESYVLNADGTASLCYGLSSAFLNCDTHWKMTKDETEHSRAKFELYVKPYNRTYETGSFYVDVSDGQSVVCAPDTKRGLRTTIGTAELAGTLISVLCFAIAIVLVSLDRSFGRHTVLLKYHLLTFALGFLAASVRVAMNTRELCEISSYLTQFFILSAFLFLNFSTAHSYFGRTTLEGKDPDYFLYKVFGFGFPLVITVSGLLADTWKLATWSPGFKYHCWFQLGSMSSIVYYYGWMALGVLANIVIVFFCTCFSLVKENNRNSVRGWVHFLLVMSTLFFVVVKLLVWFLKSGDVYAVYSVWWLSYLNAVTQFLGFLELLVIVIGCVFGRCFTKSLNINGAAHDTKL